jgi:predicted Holliday junction resolvase-like endonuclease
MNAGIWPPVLAAIAAVLALLLVRARAELRASARMLAARQRALEAEAREALERWKRSHEVEIREDAIRRSQAVVAGKATEHLVPFLPEFPFDPRDARFLGAPVDLVVFDGMTAGELRKVVFVEVKTGLGASLSTRERRLRDAIAQGRVGFVEIRVPGPEATPLASSYYVPLEELEGIASGQLELRPDESKLRYWVDWSEPPLEYTLASEAILRHDGRPWLKLAPEGELLVLDLGYGQRLEVDRHGGRLVIEGRFYRLPPERLGTVRGVSALKLDGGR